MSMASCDFLQLSRVLKSTESGRRLQQLINLSLKTEERVELLKRLYSLKYINFSRKNEMKWNINVERLGHSTSVILLVYNVHVPSSDRLQTTWQLFIRQLSSSSGGDSDFFTARKPLDTLLPCDDTANWGILLFSSDVRYKEHQDVEKLHKWRGEQPPKF